MFNDLKHSFLSKPWPNDYILETFKNISRFKDTNYNSQLKFPDKYVPWLKDIKELIKESSYSSP